VIIAVAMAGRGERFHAEAPDLPKPLIPVRGKPMFLWALAGLPLAQASRVLLIVNGSVAAHAPADRAREWGVDGEIREVVLDEITRGQAESVLLGLAAAGCADSDESLVIFNSDTVINDGWYHEILDSPADLGGALQVFEADGDHWSFAELDAGGFVRRTTEKERISPWCSTGLYWFSSTARFCGLVNEALGAWSPGSNEIYVAPLFNLLIGAGERVKAISAREVTCLGTPTELDRFDPDWRRSALAGRSEPIRNA
jgi:NDP-sugar pyrophosphorylase family protein